jgi:hypothetical protein
MAYRFLNNARMTVASAPGTGDIVVGTAIIKFQDFASAGLTDGDMAHFRAEDGNDWELFLGTYDADTTTLTRTALVDSSTGSSLSLTSNAEIEAVPVAEALELLAVSINLPRAADQIEYYTGALTKALTQLAAWARTDLLSLESLDSLEALLELALLAPLASPTFTGTPEAPTASKDTSTTQLATTEFADRAVKETSINLRTASYVLALTDKGKTIEMDVASANTLTVPPNSSVALPIGTYINVIQIGAGQTTITPGSGVTLRNHSDDGLKTKGQWGALTLYKRGTDEWVVIGGAA